MILNESVQDDVIEQFKEVKALFDEFTSSLSGLSVAAESEKDLKFEIDYFSDYCNNEVSKKLKDLEEEILDVYYPIDYGDDIEDSQEAGEVYRSSKEAREEVFK